MKSLEFTPCLYYNSGHTKLLMHGKFLSYEFYFKGPSNL